jgi:hypothetical protein
MDSEQRERIVSITDWPGAAPNDVFSPDAVVGALYEVISGEAESVAPRNWTRFRSLCLPEARFLLTRWGSAEREEQVLRQWAVEEFIEAARGFWAAAGFWEQQLWNRTDRFGNMAQVLSTYESRAGNRDSHPVGRGVNSFQLVRFDGRWWLASTVWDVESAGHSIPAEYMPPT